MQRFAWLVPMLLTAAACEHDKYQIDMAPRKGRLVREVHVKTVGGREGVTSPVDEEVVQRIRDAYKRQPGFKRVGERQFRAAFGTMMPDDVGGAGRYLHLPSTFGEAHVYIERFGGNDDPAGRLRRQFAAADRVAELLAGWLESELGGQTGWDRLRAFCREDLPRDLRNLTLTLWLVENTAGGHLEGEEAERDEAHHQRQLGELVARVGLYAVEHGYFEARELPSLTRHLLAARELGAEPEPALLELLQRLVRNRMGPDAPGASSDAWDFLASQGALERSMHAYLRTTPEYGLRLAARKQAHPQQVESPGAEDAAPDPEDILTQPVETMFALSLDVTGTRDELVVRLQLPAQPLWTNGVWDDANNIVSWNRRLSDHGADTAALPNLCYAVAVVPDDAAQRKHLGQAGRLDEQDLLTYCLWRNGLTPGQADRWASFVSKLRPGAQVRPLARRMLGPPETQPATGAVSPHQNRYEPGLMAILSAMQQAQ